MKKNLYLFIFLVCWATGLHSYAANVVPVGGTYYNIVQLSSNKVLGTLSDYPAIQTPDNSLAQAIRFVPVDGLADTYYIVNGYGKYMSKYASNTWNVVYLDQPNGNQSQWTIVNDASSATSFRLLLVYSNSYLASDGVTDGSRVYYDKTNTNTNGVFSLQTSSFPSALISAYYNYSPPGDLSDVTADLNLPTSIAGGISISWTSSRPDVISNTGAVTPVDKYNAYSVLTANMSSTVNGVTYQLTKQFTAIIKSTTPMAEDLADWDFNPSSVSIQDGAIQVADNLGGFVGTIKNDARIRTIGGSDDTRVNVLDLGNGTGYFDMGTDIGKAVYGIGDYTIAGFYRVDDAYQDLESAGNFYWTFSNTNDADSDPSGYMIGSLRSQSQSITATNWNSTGNQAVSYGQVASKGGWHHIAYVHVGNTGTIYVDGEAKAESSLMTIIPGLSLAKTGRTGTIYNWLGRSCYTSDVYLRNTLLYGFRVLSAPLSGVDVNDYLSVAGTIEKLNAAYAENPDYIPGELSAEQANLELGDLSGVTSSLSLPLKGSLDPSIDIVWHSGNEDILTSAGVVKRPRFINKSTTLIATLLKQGQTVQKTFDVTILARPDSTFSTDLIAKYDFSQVSGNVVTDAAEQHFEGQLKSDASVATIGTTTSYNVLRLGNSDGYFDLGEDLGMLIYKLHDYTISAYYRIDDDYSAIGTNGNYLWNFSNTSNFYADARGHLYGTLTTQRVGITPEYYNKEQYVSVGQPAVKGSWHHLAYTQSGDKGTVYVDGVPLATGTVTQVPSNTLVSEGAYGTKYNWIGRSVYQGYDVFLRKSLVYDFRIYRSALTEEQIQKSELNVGETIVALDKAYGEGFSSIRPGTTATQGSPYLVKAGNGLVQIAGLTGGEKVSIYDLSGRRVTSGNQSEVSLSRGIYIVKVNNYVTKVIVK